MASIGTSSDMQKQIRQTRAQLQETVQQLKALAVSFITVTVIPLQPDFSRTKRCRSAAQEYKHCSQEVLHAGVKDLQAICPGHGGCTAYNSIIKQFANANAAQNCIHAQHGSAGGLDECHALLCG